MFFRVSSENRIEIIVYMINIIYENVKDKNIYKGN